MGKVGEVEITICPPAFTYASPNKENISLKDEDRKVLREHIDTLRAKELEPYRNRYKHRKGFVRKEI